jgi:hypothetical protein
MQIYIDIVYRIRLWKEGVNLHDIIRYTACHLPRIITKFHLYNIIMLSIYQYTAEPYNNMIFTKLFAGSYYTATHRAYVAIYLKKFKYIIYMAAEGALGSSNREK